MTIYDLIQMLEGFVSAGDASYATEVVATDDTGETHTPVISIAPDRDGVRRLRVC